MKRNVAVFYLSVWRETRQTWSRRPPTSPFVSDPPRTAGRRGQWLYPELLLRDRMGYFPFGGNKDPGIGSEDRIRHRQDDTNQAYFVRPRTRWPGEGKADSKDVI
jgi:hypothetical protein